MPNKQEKYAVEKRLHPDTKDRLDRLRGSVGRFCKLMELHAPSFILMSEIRLMERHALSAIRIQDEADADAEDAR